MNHSAQRFKEVPRGLNYEHFAKVLIEKMKRSKDEFGERLFSNRLLKNKLMHDKINYKSLNQN